MADQPKLNPLPDNEQGEWQDLINSVEVTDIPLEMVKVLRVHLREGHKLVFPVRHWLDDGYSLEKIEAVVNRYFDDHQDEILANDLVMDIEKLKDTVTLETNKALKDI